MQFSTLITLTVATSMAVLSAMAAPAAPKCGTVCPTVYQPVCAKAIDGLNKVFDSACELKNYNCKHPNAKFVVVGNSVCLDFVAVEKRAAPKCDTVCPAVYQPVCAKAINGLNKAFGNACELKNYNCEHPNANFVTVANTECKDIPAPAPVCNKACTKIFKPVCAKLQSGKSQTFSNACEMDVFNCEHPDDKAQLVANAACPATPAPVCNKACPYNYDPVCAKVQSGETKTFGNACELNVYKCENPTDKIELLASADCAAAAPACALACPTVYKPVCAKYPNGNLQTFGNKCELNVFNCKNPAITFSLITEGDCDAN
ncbi:Serine protease inhibitor Kazal-type 5 [Linnemannia gamsii]|uniref:Serine protease inhibitor Kazal-type 5 n=1 Tax=Linnemannia gamsii TaxID=64522 RepID=A0ABQ7JRR1_9FUNG|nr:Serine protease inhibitor Kazal-type 5 [Linnemannia gamsii]